MLSNLSARQLKFVVAYVAMPNATQAAREAGYSPKAAECQGSRLLSNAKVRAALDAAFAEDAKQRGVTKGEIVAAHRREMYNFVDGTPMSRIRAGEALSRLLGYDQFKVSVENTSLPAHEHPDLRALLRMLPPDKLRQFEETMRFLAEAEGELAKRKQIEHTPPESDAT